MTAPGPPPPSGTRSPRDDEAHGTVDRGPFKRVAFGLQPSGSHEAVGVAALTVTTLVIGSVGLLQGFGHPVGSGYVVVRVLVVCAVVLNAWFLYERYVRHQLTAGAVGVQLGRHAERRCWRWEGIRQFRIVQTPWVLFSSYDDLTAAPEYRNEVWVQMVPCDGASVRLVAMGTHRGARSQRSGKIGECLVGDEGRLALIDDVRTLNRLLEEAAQRRADIRP